MSQLRNLLTNKILAHKLGSGRNLSHLRRAKKSVKTQARKIREEIVHRAAQQSPYIEPGVTVDSKRPSLFSRARNLFSRAIKGS
jgi:ribosomal protein L10